MSSSKKARNTAARLVAVQCVYDMVITGHSANEALEAYKDHRHETTFEVGGLASFRYSRSCSRLRRRRLMTVSSSQA